MIHQFIGSAAQKGPPDCRMPLMTKHQQITVLLFDIFQDHLSFVTAQHSAVCLHSPLFCPLAQRSLQAIEVFQGRQMFARGFFVGRDIAWKRLLN